MTQRTITLPAGRMLALQTPGKLLQEAGLSWSSSAGPVLVDSAFPDFVSADRAVPVPGNGLNGNGLSLERKVT